MLDQLELRPDLRDAVDAELAVGETIRWAGQPDPRRMMLSSLPIVLFAIPWTAFSLFWMGTALAVGGPNGLMGIVFPLFGLPFVLIGLAMFSAPVWMWWGARRTAYVVSNERAIIFNGTPWGLKIRSFAPAELTLLERTQRADGSGSVHFAIHLSRDTDGNVHRAKIGFEAIQDIREVEALLRELAASTEQRP
ncbi:MAG: hypothetical protein ACRC1K_14000 [Planctomycetia bacterium]